MISAAHRTSRTSHRAAVWSDRVWPVLAGTLLAVGAAGIVHAWGPLALLLVPAGTWAFLTVMLYGTLSEFGLSLGGSVRTGLVATAVIVDLLGLMLISSGLGALAGLVGCLTSPLVIDRAAGLLRRRSSATSQARVDRRFARIVAEIEKDPSWRHPA